MSRVHTLSDLKKQLSEGNRPDRAHSERNTVIGRGFLHQTKSAWGFTLNNYNDKDIDRVKSRKFIFQKNQIEIVKYLFQKEVGEKSGVPHLQGCVYFKNVVSGACVKALLPKANWSASRNWHALLNYCSKAFTRNGEIYRYGCVENRIKHKETDAEKEMRWIVHIKRMQDELSKDVCEKLYGMCFDVGHPVHDCWCRKK